MQIGLCLKNIAPLLKDADVIEAALYSNGALVETYSTQDTGSTAIKPWINETYYFVADPALFDAGTVELKYRTKVGSTYSQWYTHTILYPKTDSV